MMTSTMMRTCTHLSPRRLRSSQQEVWTLLWVAQASSTVKLACTCIICDDGPRQLSSLVKPKRNACWRCVHVHVCVCVCVFRMCVRTDLQSFRVLTTDGAASRVPDPDVVTFRNMGYVRNVPRNVPVVFAHCVSVSTLWI